MFSFREGEKKKINKKAMLEFYKEATKILSIYKWSNTIKEMLKYQIHNKIS